MKKTKSTILIIGISISLFSCGNSDNSAKNMGASTPIDSSNVKGTAGATYGGNNPANDQRDSNRSNTNDTGTKANNIHNEGTR
jgi:hypothetical protein